MQMPSLDTPVRHLSWPTPNEVDNIKATVAADAGVSIADVLVVYSPYRVCPLGAHVDHQGGMVSASAVDFGVVLAFVPTHDGTVHLTSSTFQSTVHFSLDAIPPALRKETPNEPCCWGNFPRGAAFALHTKGYQLIRGIRGHLWSPEGLDSSGISSSAAVGVAYLLAYQAANGLLVTPEDNIELDRLIENRYLGLKNGILDQSAILLSQPGYALTVIDCKTCTWRHVQPPWQHEIPPIKVLLVFSGIREALASGASFNTRVTECHQAAQQLLHAATATATVATTADGCHGDTHGRQHMCHGEVQERPMLLGDFDKDVYLQHRDVLDETSQRRAAHFFSETERVQRGAALWEAGDLHAFGQLMKQSGRSSIENYQVGTPQLIALQQALHECPGVYGARFSGAGTRGACVAMVDAAQAVDVAHRVLNTYLEAFPSMRGAAQAVVCDLGTAARVDRGVDVV